MLRSDGCCYSQTRFDCTRRLSIAARLAGHIDSEMGDDPKSKPRHAGGARLSDANYFLALSSFISFSSFDLVSFVTSLEDLPSFLVLESSAAALSLLDFVSFLFFASVAFASFLAFASVAASSFAFAFAALSVSALSALLIFSSLAAVLASLAA